MAFGFSIAILVYSCATFSGGASGSPLCLYALGNLMHTNSRRDFSYQLMLVSCSGIRLVRLLASNSHSMHLRSCSNGDALAFGLAVAAAFT